MAIRLFLILSLLVPATALADDDDDGETISYRRTTLTADAIGLGMFVAGGFVEADRGDTTASNTLFTASLFTMTLATPAIHALRGHGNRAMGSLLLRTGVASAGLLVVNAACGDDFGCETEYLVPLGMYGGLVVASAIDAAFMTDEHVEESSWAPQAWANQHGAGGGVAFAW